MLITVLDIETTGLSRFSDEILELGWIRFDNETLKIHTYGDLFYYQEGFDVGKYPACKIHRLTRGALEPHMEEFPENVAAMYTLLHKGVILGKNSNAFDIPMIQSFVSKHSENKLFPVPLGVLDLQEFYEPYYQKYYVAQNGVATRKKGTLCELMEMIGYTQPHLEAEYTKIFPDVERTGAHSALFDAYETYLLTVYGVQDMGLRLKLYE